MNNQGGYQGYYQPSQGPVYTTASGQPIDPYGQRLAAAQPQWQNNGQAAGHHQAQTTTTESTTTTVHTLRGSRQHRDMQSQPTQQYYQQATGAYAPPTPQFVQPAQQPQYAPVHQQAPSFDYEGLKIAAPPAIPATASSALHTTTTTSQTMTYDGCNAGGDARKAAE